MCQWLSTTKCENRTALVTQAFICRGSREVQTLQWREDINGHENKISISCNIHITLYSFLQKDTHCRATETSLTADHIYCPFPVVIIFSMRGMYIIALCICEPVGKEFCHLHLFIYIIPLQLLTPLLSHTSFVNRVAQKFVEASARDNWHYTYKGMVRSDMSKPALIFFFSLQEYTQQNPLSKF
jgi:hypothetical protein